MRGSSGINSGSTSISTSHQRSLRDSKNNAVLFADDTNIYGEISEEKYDLDLNNIETWMAANKLTMSQDKTQKILFSSKKLTPLIKF